MYVHSYIYLLSSLVPDLRFDRDNQGGVTQIIRVTPSELAKHNTREDCWQAYNGKVYNVTPYLKYHPGGIAEVMRARGKDGTELFSEYPIFST